MTTKKRIEGLFHVTVTSLGTDFGSQGFKRHEDTNPAKIAMWLVTRTAESCVGLDDDDPKTEREKRNFFVSVGVGLLKYAQLTDESLAKPIKDIVEQWEILLTEWEQDKEKYEAKKKELVEKAQKKT
jgi:hypothetical protein